MSPSLTMDSIFGKPNQGIHSYRFMNVAIVDVLMTVVVSFVISKYFGYSFMVVLILAFLMGIILHHIFHVKTTIEKLLFS
jgi:hypothetical protein